MSNTLNSKAFWRFFEGYLPQNDKKFTQNGVYADLEAGYN